MGDITIPANVRAQLSEPIRDTLSEVLNDPTLNRHFGGSDERLSAAQSGLAAAVTVKLQERLIEQMHQSHQRELGLIAGFWKLYKTPLFQMPSHSQTAPVIEEGKTIQRTRFSELFSWGNILGGAALIIIALAFYYTKLTSSYEEHWKNAEADLKVLREQYVSEEKANEALQTELGKAQSRAEAAEASLRNLTALSADQQKVLLSTIQDLSAQRGELAKQVAGSSGERKFQNLYKTAADEVRVLREEKATLKIRADKCDEQRPKP